MVRILILGNSDTRGPDGHPDARSWPAVMAERLAGELGSRPEIIDKALYAQPGAATYAERLLTQYDPDPVILPLSAHHLAARTVNQRLKRRLPATAFRFVMLAGNGFKAVTVRTGRTGHRVDRAVRRWLYRTVGQELTVDADAAAEAYAAVLRVLARQERVVVLVSSGTRYGRGAHRQAPELDRDIAAFQRQMQNAALQHRLPWLDLEAALQASGRREACYQADGIHKTVLGQRVIGEAFAKRLKPLLS